MIYLLILFIFIPLFYRKCVFCNSKRIEYVTTTKYSGIKHKRKDGYSDLRYKDNEYTNYVHKYGCCDCGKTFTLRSFGTPTKLKKVNLFGYVSDKIISGKYKELLGIRSDIDKLIDSVKSKGERERLQKLSGSFDNVNNFISQEEKDWMNTWSMSNSK